MQHPWQSTNPSEIWTKDFGVTVMLCAKFQKDLLIKKEIMYKQNFVRFQFQMD